MKPYIEQIKAEVERLISNNKTKNGFPAGTLCAVRIEAYEHILSFLDTIQEPIDKWSNNERKASVKKTGEIVCGFTDGQGHFDIPTDHNEFIRYNLDELEFDTLQEQPVCEDLEKEIERYKTDMEYLLAQEYGKGFETNARHFAQWQKEQMMDEWLKDRDGCFWDGVNEGKKAMKEQMMKEAVEGKVYMSFAPGHNQMVMADTDLPTNTKVKLIIVKED